MFKIEEKIEAVFEVVDMSKQCFHINITTPCCDQWGKRAEDKKNGNSMKKPIAPKLN